MAGVKAPGRKVLCDKRTFRQWMCKAKADGQAAGSQPAALSRCCAVTSAVRSPIHGVHAPSTSCYAEPRTALIVRARQQLAQLPLLQPCLEALQP